MEAMAEGLPCIVSDIRGNIDLIEDEKGGYLCRPGDANAFAEKITTLRNSKELRSRMGLYNRNKISEFDEKIINQRMKEIYSDIEMRNGGIRILHFLKTGNYSGAEKVAITLISEMKNKYGCEGIYVSLSGNIDDVLEKNGIEHAVIKANTVKEYQRVINRYHPDVIHAHDFGASVIASNTKNHAVMISHLHNNPPWIKKICLRTLMYAYAARKFQKVLVVSQSVLDEYVWKKSFLAKAVVVGNPVDSKKVICLADKEAENIEKSDVVFLGRFTHQKNPIAFINIISACKSKNRKIHALMLGQGELYGKCKDKIVQLGLEQNVKQLGFKENPYGYLKKTKVLCVPSVWEGFGLVVVEAFALGIPVVATPVGGMKNLVTDEAGFLSTDEKQLSEEIIRLLTNDAYYRKKSEGALKRAQQLDNIDEYIKTIYGLYKGTS
jgi:glycosyltransferase involved in cell wall biosynthesis